MNPCNYILEKILSFDFSSLSYEEQLNVIKNQQPHKPIQLQTKIKTFIRHFNYDMYTINSWLCGCSLIKKYTSALRIISIRKKIYDLNVILTILIIFIKQPKGILLKPAKY